MRNDYEINGDVTTFYINHKGEKTSVLIDTEDLPKVASYRWYGKFMKSTQTIYVYTQTSDRKTIHLHRLLMNTPNDKVVDHINHNTLDNRKVNLRNVTTGENHQNKIGAYSNSKSGVRGVHWCNVRNKWLVRLQVAGKKRTIGEFNDLEEAKECIAEARKQHMPYSLEALNKRGLFSMEVGV